MRRWYELVLAAQDDIATIMTVESGKPLAESKAEFLGGCAAYASHVPHVQAFIGRPSRRLLLNRQCARHIAVAQVPMSMPRETEGPHVLRRSAVTHSVTGAPPAHRRH